MKCMSFTTDQPLYFFFHFIFVLSEKPKVSVERILYCHYHCSLPLIPFGNWVTQLNQRTMDTEKKVSVCVWGGEQMKESRNKQYYKRKGLKDGEYETM